MHFLFDLLCPLRYWREHLPPNQAKMPKDSWELLLDCATQLNKLLTRSERSSGFPLYMTPCVVLDKREVFNSCHQ